MSEWDAYAADWDDDPAARAYAAAAFASLQPVLDRAGLDLAGAAVVDFGCGTGLLTERLVEQGASVVAVDNSAAMLDVVQAKITDRGWANVHTSAELPTMPGSFQLVVCSSVCSFLDDFPITAQVLAALLTPGGVFVQWDWERDESDEDSHGLSRTEIAAALRAAGLHDVSVDVGFEVPFEDQVMRPLMGYGFAPSTVTEAAEVTTRKSNP